MRLVKPCGWLEMVLVVGEEGYRVDEGGEANGKVEGFIVIEEEMMLSMRIQIKGKVFPLLFSEKPERVRSTLLKFFSFC